MAAEVEQTEHAIEDMRNGLGVWQRSGIGREVPVALDLGL